MPTVSIIMPCFNHARYIYDAIDSILSQDYSDFELLVTDDLSTDGSRPIILDYAKRDQRVIPLLHSKNEGEAKSRNDALLKARGEFIAFCDSDDMWEPNKLSFQLDSFDRNPEVGVVHSDSIIIDGNGKPTGEKFSELHQKGMKRSGDLFHQLCLRNFINVPTVMFRKKCLVEAGFEVDFRYLTDWIYWARIAKNHTFLFSDTTLARYRVHDGSTANDRKKYHHYRIKGYNLLLKEFPDIPRNIASEMEYLLGVNHLSIHERSVAREHLIRSLKLNPANYKSIFRVFFPNLFVRQ